VLSPRVILVAGLVLLSLSCAEEKRAPSRAEEKQRDRTILPPHLCLATAVEKDGVVRMRISASIIRSYKVTSPVPYTIEVPTKEGEKKRYETRWERKTATRYRSYMKKAVVVVDGEQVQVSRKNGKKVDPRDLPKLLRKETPVFVFTGGKIDPYYLQVIQEETLIVVIPESTPFPARPDRKAADTRPTLLPPSFAKGRLGRWKARLDAKPDSMHTLTKVAYAGEVFWVLDVHIGDGVPHKLIALYAPAPHGSYRRCLSAESWAAGWLEVKLKDKTGVLELREAANSRLKGQVIVSCNLNSVGTQHSGRSR
jgi:hypothetical protein